MQARKQQLKGEKHMARLAAIESIEQKIEKAQVDVAKAKHRYDAAIARLEGLMDKRDAIKRDVLVTTIMKSNKSYDEVLRFLNNDICQVE